MTLDDSFNPSNLFKCIYVLCVISEKFIFLIKCCNKSVTQRRDELTRINLL